MDQRVIEALKAKYEAQEKEALANFQILMEGKTSIPDHGCFVETAHKLLVEIDHARALKTTLADIWSKGSE